MVERPRRRILLIDDDQLQFRLTQAHFRRFRGEQFELDWESDYAGGLRRLLGGGYAACFLDYQLGERDGLELIQEAVAQGCRTPIIFFTAESSPQIDIQAMNAGAFDFLVKGELTPSSLERALRYAVKLGETLASLHQFATRDELTGLYNRREFQRIQGAQEERARSTGQPLALLMIDLDHFKGVNDRLGHAAGDQVLRQAAERIQAATRSADYAGRLGGDEFAVLLIGTDREGALTAAERVRSALASAPLQAAGNDLTVTASIGLAVLGPRPGDAAGGREELLAAADRAMYQAKLAGRNRVERWAPR